MIMDEIRLHMIRVQEMDLPRKRVWWLFPDNIAGMHEVFKSLMPRDRTIEYFKKSRNIQLTKTIVLTYDNIMSIAEAIIIVTEVINRNRQKELDLSWKENLNE